MRVYILKGKKTTLMWLRDTTSTWQSELVNNIPAQVLTNKHIDLSSFLGSSKLKKIEAYNPWDDRWLTLNKSKMVQIPDFRRSIVIKILHN
jgi:hypothetical protein